LRTQPSWVKVDLVASFAPQTDAVELERLRSSVHAFVRSFGLLAGDRTPCGQPLPVSHAHALIVLRAADRAGLPTTQQALARSLRIDKSNVARLCARMEVMGHVAQRRSPDDGRARLLALTPKGRRVAERVDASSRARFQQLLGSIPESARGGVIDALDALAQAATRLDAKETP
jgi:DNA-binding MarR family transcriptional regulator